MAWPWRGRGEGNGWETCVPAALSAVALNSNLAVFTECRAVEGRVKGGSGSRLRLP